MVEEKAMVQGYCNNSPDQDQFQGKGKIDRLAARAGKRFQETVEAGSREDAPKADPRSVESRKGQFGMSFEYQKGVLLGSQEGQAGDGQDEDDHDDSSSQGPELPAGQKPLGQPPGEQGRDQGEGDGRPEIGDEQKAGAGIDKGATGARGGG